MAHVHVYATVEMDMGPAVRLALEAVKLVGALVPLIPDVKAKERVVKSQASLAQMVANLARIETVKKRRPKRARRRRPPTPR